MSDTPLWTIAEVLAACGGTLHGTPATPMNGVAIDSRAIAPGDIFVAIKGDKLDGHDFVASALNAGAGLAIVSRTTPAMLAAGPVLAVPDDPLDALVRLGRAARQRSPAKVIAVTGSVGKTSTKEMLALAFAASGHTHASVASFNNHWGVPLTLARLHRTSAFGVFEIGMNHAGEITPLVDMVKPHIAIITTIAASHLGHFNSLDEIAMAKAEIFSGVIRGGTAVINRDTPFFDFLAAQANSHGVTSIVSFGRHDNADVRLTKAVLQPDYSSIAANVMGEELVYKLGVPGEHMAINSLAVLAAVKKSGADLARAALALSTAKPAKGRGVQEHLKTGGADILLLDESYNANPASVRAALALLGQISPARGSRRIAVLGDMLELGDFGPKLHAGLVDELQAGKVDQLFACGPLMAHLWNETPLARRGAYAKDSNELAPLLLQSVRPGDVIMIKGSLGSRMGPLADQLRARYQPAKKEV